jgi:uncharacterized protein
MTVRTREHHVVAARSGAPELVYDLERTLVFALADAAGDGTPLQDCLLVNDIVTTAAAPPPFVPAASLVVDHVSLDISGACNMACAYCFEADIGARRGKLSPETLDRTVETIFGQAGDRLAFDFASGEPLTSFPTLVEAVGKIERKAAATGRRVSFGLTTNATLISEKTADFLADHAFDVKVSLDGPPELHDANRPMLGGQPSYRRVMRGLDLLSRRLPRSALTANTVVHPEASLGRLWDWAKGLPVGTWVTVPVGERAGAPAQAAIARRRRDLERIADEIACAVERGMRVVAHDALIKVVRKLAVPAPTARFCGAGGSFLGVRSDGQVYPCLRQLGLEEHRLGDVVAGLNDRLRRRYLDAYAKPVDRRSECRSCWARHLCGGGCYADSIVYGDDPVAPLTSHCPFFRLEIETAIRLFDRLRSSAPMAVVDLFGLRMRAEVEHRLALAGVG